jgi:hypothetical protein
LADKPETLEETQARLARVADGATAAPPSVSVPVPSVSGPPATPYGPVGAGAPDLAQLGGAGEFGAAPQRPDPYGGPGLMPSSPQPAVATPRRPAAAIGIGLGVVAMLAIGGVVAYNAFQYAAPEAYDPIDEPVYSEEWQNFPGISYIDPNDALTQPSYEEVVANTEDLVAQFKDSLTDEFGLVWSQNYESYTGVESNGYGGDSMLYYYDTGNWQGQVKLDDPGARERVYELFVALAEANGGDGVLLRNDLYADDADISKAEFGSADRDAQALWSFFDSFPSLADGYLSADVMDRTVPVDESFYGDYMFTYDESSTNLYVSINSYVGGLLKEADRTAFEEALAPYNGDYEP